MHVVITHDRSNLASTGLISLAALIASTAAVGWWGLTGAMIVGALAFGAWAALVDARSGRVPNLLVAAAAVPTLAVVASSAIAGSGAQTVAATALGGLAFAGPVFVMHVMSPGAMGFGDVKLAAVLGAALGLIGPRFGMLALCVAAAITATIGLARRRPSLPFGPGLVLGAATALLLAGQFGEEAVPWR